MTRQQGVNYCTIILAPEWFIAINNCFHVFKYIFSHHKKQKWKVLANGRNTGRIGHSSPTSLGSCYFDLLLNDFGALLGFNTMWAQSPVISLRWGSSPCKPLHRYSELGSSSHLFSVHFHPVHFSHTDSVPCGRLLTSEKCISLF